MFDASRREYAMIRVIKPEGFGNIQLEDIPIPEINSRQVLVKDPHYTD